MLSKIRFGIVGVVPLLMHNGQMCDPLNEHTKDMKKITRKRNKTDEDHEEIARIEFMAGIYTNEKKEPVIPSQLIEAMFVNAAKTRKQGPVFKASVFCEEDWPLHYKGPKTARELWLDDSFRDTRPVIVNRSRIMRTRPKFNNWSLVFEVTFDPQQVEAGDIIECAKIAGLKIGLCDYRPKFGRFDVDSSEVISNGNGK